MIRIFVFVVATFAMTQAALACDHCGKHHHHGGHHWGSSGIPYFTGYTYCAPVVYQPVCMPVCNPCPPVCVPVCRPVCRPVCNLPPLQLERPQQPITINVNVVVNANANANANTTAAAMPRAPRRIQELPPPAPAPAPRRLRPAQSPEQAPWDAKSEDFQISYQGDLEVFELHAQYITQTTFSDELGLQWTLSKGEQIAVIKLSTTEIICDPKYDRNEKGYLRFSATWPDGKERSFVRIK